MARLHLVIRVHWNSHPEAKDQATNKMVPDKIPFTLTPNPNQNCKKKKKTLIINENVKTYNC